MFVCVKERERTRTHTDTHTRVEIERECVFLTIQLSLRSIARVHDR